MKSQILTLASLLAAGTMSLQSCLDYDTPASNVTKSEGIVERVTYNSGKADSILYTKLASRASVDSSLNKLTLNFGQMLTAQYAMRGGKEGAFPGAHAYQYQFTMCIDNYAGYSVLPHNFSSGTGGSMSSTYDDNPKYTSGANGSYGIVRNGVVPLLNHPAVDSVPELKAAALLLFNYASQEVTDVYGPITYQDYKRQKEDFPYTYNSVHDIYHSIVENLDTINACFKHYPTKPEWYRNKVDSVVKKYISIAKAPSIENLRLLANSLKLRMAMHIVKVSPDTAKLWAEAAIKEGVITSHEEEAALYPSVLGFTNPLVEISESWSDTRLNASFESLLMSLNHPYINYIFRKNSGDLNNSTDPSLSLPSGSRIVGLRAGTYMSEGQSYDVNTRIAYSRIDKRPFAQAPLYIMKLAEVQFLRAEGALRGWDMGGTAESFYNAGIDNAFLDDPSNNSRYTSRLEAYKAQKEATAYTYVDPLDAANNAESVTKIGVAWDATDSKETMLEKIITQKYIALYPYSYEAWTEARRTGYPKMFPVLNVDDGDGSLKPGDLIRRIPFPGRSEASVAADIATSGLKALGGEDVQATRLWWDKNQANF